METASAASVAGVEPGAREIGHGVVAGLRLVAERRLPGCGEGVPIAGRLSVRAAGGTPPGGGFVVPPGERGSAWLRLDGRRLLLAGEAEWGARVRRLVPYASWLQGLPVLHAATVERDAAALALVGASGVGKSTLASSAMRWAVPAPSPARPAIDTFSGSGLGWRQHQERPAGPDAATWDGHPRCLSRERGCGRGDSATNCPEADPLRDADGAGSRHMEETPRAKRRP